MHAKKERKKERKSRRIQNSLCYFWNQLTVSRIRKYHKQDFFALNFALNTASLMLLNLFWIF